MMNLTRLQVLAITIGVLTFINGSVAQLDVLFGVQIEKLVVAALTLITGSLAVVMTVMSGQSSQVANVQALPGVSKILVNERAGAALAQQATSGDTPKVMAEEGAEKRVEAIAKQG